MGAPRVSRAAPPLVVRATGDCPSQHEVEQALCARGFALGGGFLVATQADHEGVVLRLGHPNGEWVAERRFASQDCPAMAAAVAVVVEAYFVELDAARARGPSPPSSTAPNADVSPQKSDISRPVAYSNPAPNPVRGATAWNTGASSRGAPASLWALTGNGFAGVGPALALPGGQMTPQLTLGAGLDLSPFPATTQLALSNGLASTSGSEPQRIRRQGTEALLRIGIHSTGYIHFRPWLGAGLGVARVRALDIPEASEEVSTTGLLGLGFQTVWPLGKWWSAILDVGCLVLLTRDTYRVEPDGVVGRGPRGICSASLGVGLGSF